MRHKWVKPRLHVYICRVCGTGRVNAQKDGQWVTTFHRPDGSTLVSSRVPACEVGPLTEKYLAKYAPAVACAERHV